MIAENARIMSNNPAMLESRRIVDQVPNDADRTIDSLALTDNRSFFPNLLDVKKALV
jgi:hypothetical protein